MLTELRPIADPVECHLSPEQELIAAVLRTAMNDAMVQGAPGSPAWYVGEDARRWLQRKAVVVEWLTMAGLPETVYDVMLAHVARGKPNRGPWRV